MAIESGTAYRIQVNGKKIYGATQGQANYERSFRQTIHKDNPSEWTEKSPDGKDAKYQVTFFLDQDGINAGTHLGLADLWALYDNGTVVPLEVSNGATGKKKTQQVYIGNIGESFTVRDNVVVNVSMEGTGAVAIADVTV